MIGPLYFAFFYDFYLSCLRLCCVFEYSFFYFGASEDFLFAQSLNTSSGVFMNFAH